MKNTCNPLQLAESLSEHWFPNIIASIDGHYVKVAKLKGSFVWHDHVEQDEMFFILKGAMVMEYEDRKVALSAGDLHVVPRGVKHHPVAEDECLVMLIENQGTKHTGEVVTPYSRSVKEQLG